LNLFCSPLSDLHLGIKKRPVGALAFGDRGFVRDESSYTKFVPAVKDKQNRTET
jgi:hypothetical protein